MHIKKVDIKDFVVFSDLSIEFNSGMNILIGENGVGKTQLLKGLYSKLIDKDSDISPKAQYTKYFGAPPLKNEISCFEIQKIGDEIKNVGAYIPPKDMLTHARGFLSMNDKFDMPFDRIYYDIISKSLLPNLREIPEIGKNILPKIEKIIGGKVIVENETFFIKKTNGDIVNFALEAEGFKKIAIIWQLIMNETIFDGSILFWDEPESNVNPKLIPSLVEILLELSQNNVQIFIATHDYILAKYIEVKSENYENISYHSFLKTESKVEVETQNKFTLLSNNAIIEENKNLYMAEVEKVMSPLKTTPEKWK